jgi:hypothetical protein
MAHFWAEQPVPDVQNHPYQPGLVLVHVDGVRLLCAVKNAL